MQKKKITEKILYISYKNISEFSLRVKNDLYDSQYNIIEFCEFSENETYDFTSYLGFIIIYEKLPKKEDDILKLDRILNKLDGKIKVTIFHFDYKDVIGFELEKQLNRKKNNIIYIFDGPVYTIDQDTTYFECQFNLAISQFSTGQ